MGRVPDTPLDLHELSSDLVVHAARLTRAIRRASEHPASVRILSLLDQLGPCGVSALAAADRSSQPTMSAAVTALVEQGWVTKRPSPTDARSQLVDLTDAGRAELARVRRSNADVVASRLAATTHTVEEVATAVAVLRDLLDPATGKVSL